MKRFLAVLCCLLFVALPARSAPAAGGGNTLQVTSVVNSDGSCQMTVQITLQLEQAVSQLTLPVGSGARDAAVNGAAVRVRKVSGMSAVILEQESGFTGTQNLMLTYTLPDCVRAANDWKLILPLLPEGLAYPVDQMTFQVTLPGVFSELPDFTSGYYGEDIDNYMTVSVQDNVISGAVNTALRDQDSLILSMATSPELFPRTNEAGRIYPTARLAGFACAVLALLYWLLRLRWRPVWAAPQCQVPVGVGPGEVSCRLLARSPDFPLMVVAWAQLGYLTIHVNQDWAVTLHKRMDMGNERSDYENKLFRALFGREQIADGAGRRFQELRAQVSASRPRVRGQFRRRSGKPVWTRLLGALMGVCTGVGAGDMLAPPVKGRLVLLILIGLLCGTAAWLLQGGFRSLLSWDRRPGILALAGGASLLLLGAVSGCAGLAAACCLVQCLVGWLTVFGGRRSEIGRLTVQALLGLRRYLKTVGRKQLRRILSRNQNYYYDMAPYALALGVDRQFARQFAGERLPPCLWLVTDFPQGGRAEEWYPLLRQVTQILRGKLPRYTEAKPAAHAGRPRR